MNRRQYSCKRVPKCLSYWDWDYLALITTNFFANFLNYFRVSTMIPISKRKSTAQTQNLSFDGETLPKCREKLTFLLVNVALEISMEWINLQKHAIILNPIGTTLMKSSLRESAFWTARRTFRWFIAASRYWMVKCSNWRIWNWTARRYTWGMKSRISRSLSLNRAKWTSHSDQEKPNRNLKMNTFNDVQTSIIRRTIWLEPCSRSFSVGSILSVYM